MSRFLEYRWWVFCLCLAAGVRSASGFSPLGPPETWQTVDMGYERVAETRFPGNPSFSDNVWTIYMPDFSTFPKNLGEEYRWNTPVLYYAYDQSFLDYFGSNGVVAVDAAVAIMNSLSNVSSYSSDLSELPLREARVNYTAAALHLFDLKSTVLEILLERLGLTDPQQWAWTLRSRILLPGASCPIFDYAVIQRNFDPVTWQPSRYVNGTLLTYTIRQLCSPDFGDAEEFVVDPTDIYQSAVASPKISYPRTIYQGYFHTSLTRDDVGGLRYLYATNNMNIEGMGSDTVTLVTATNNLRLLVTSNLNLLAAASLTNDDATLLGLYPDLAIVPGSTIPSFTNVVSTNLSLYYTNSGFDPVGTPPHIVFATNYTTNVMFVYKRAFANVVTNSFSTRGYVTVIDTSLYYRPFLPVGYPPQTITTTRTMLTNTVSGDFYIPPPTECGLQILSNVLTTLVGVTNILVATNTPSTNAGSGTYLLSRTYINWFTNHSLAYYPVECASNSIALRQGIEKVTFVRRNYDSLIGQFFAPITNYYTSTTVTNNALVRQQHRRIVTQPDILFSASDLTAPFPYIPTVSRTAPIFATNGVLPNLAGPGTIQGLVNIQFNKVGPIYLNGFYPYAIDELSSIQDFVWGSFDGTTNAPVVYPSGTSIYNLENQVLIQISPVYLPNGSVGQPYRAQLATVGATPNWTPPFTWSLAPASAALPPGLSISSGGLISGTPTVGGFYEIVVQATDSAHRIAQRSYSLNLTGLQ